MGKSQNQEKRQKQRSTVSRASRPSAKRRAKYIWLNVQPFDRWLEVRRGETVWEALHKADIDLEGDCGGLGNCGKCKFKVLSSVDPPTKEEKDLLSEEELNQGIRLACRTRIKREMAILVGEFAPELEYVQILKRGERPPFKINPLIDQRLVALPSTSPDEGLSDFDRVKRALGPEYTHLKASMHCLRTLPEIVKEPQLYSAAVLQDGCLLGWENWEKVGRGYGLVFDLGTSTLVGKLISLLDGSEVAVICCLNSQMKHGSNIISRLQYVKDHPYSLEYLHNLLIRDMNRITERLLQLGGLEPDDVFVAVVAGNTTMQHFLLRLSPLGIAEAPFSPVLTDGLVVKAADVGLHLHPAALLYTLPMKSGYIGGDLISVVLASGAAAQKDDIILGLDLGTNGEIFLGNSEMMLTCSAAAGPALEGARISHGMIARAGAIEGIRYEDGQLYYRVIGNIKPTGICGSGLVDLVAVLLHFGIIDHEGLISSRQESAAPDLRSRVITNRSGISNFLVASAEESYAGNPIYLTQNDVRELQMAKGAIAAGIRTLMEEIGVEVQDIGRVYLAGALGNYVDPYSAMRIGLLPAVNPEIIRSLGNAASTGATMVLLSKGYWRTVAELAQFIEHVELSYRHDFNQYFIENMDFPLENLWP